MKDIIRKILMVVFAAAFLVAAFMLVKYYVNLKQEDAVDNSVAALIKNNSSSTASPAATGSDDDPEVTPVPVVLDKYSELYAQNNDAIGWLTIDDTVIDYVVMYAPEETSKYLHLDYYGNYSDRGCLFLDEDCDIWDYDNLIIYGHRMNSGAMFGHLAYYSDKSYWENHKYIKFDTIYAEQTYEVVAALYTRILYVEEEGFRYYTFTKAADEAEFNEYVDFINENQQYDTGIDISYGDKLLTLSTCSNHTANGRFIVIAKLITDE